jgi:Holliday junction resolvase RusA-like endonuclease
MIDVTFIVPRPPVAKGRPRITTVHGSVRTFTPKKTRNFELDVAAVASEHIDGVIDGPVAVDILAVLPRPKRLYRKKDPEGLVWAPKRPDADNIRKAVLDGLSTVLHDDAQVCAGETLKVYSEKDKQARTVVRVRCLPKRFEAYPKPIAAPTELWKGDEHR